MSKRILLALASIVILTMVAIPFISQKSNSAVEITKVDPAFGAYISAYTSGTISNESYIRVSLAADYKGTITLDKPIDETYFSFDPGIEGKTYWLDTRTLEFRPDKRLPSNVNYNVEFYLNKILPDVPENLATMKFSFRTMKQGMSVEVGEMKTTDKKSMRQQELSGTLITADAVDPKTVSLLLTAKQNGKHLNVKWENESDNATNRFTIDSIERGEKESVVELSWDGKELGVDVHDSKKIIIPSLRDFKVTDVRVEQGQEQCVVVEFSDPIKDKQNLDGLISISESSSSTNKISRYGSNEDKTITNVASSSLRFTVEDLS